MATELETIPDAQALADALAEVFRARDRYQVALEQIADLVNLTDRGITNLDPKVSVKVRWIIEDTIGPRCIHCRRYAYKHLPATGLKTETCPGYEKST